VNPGRRGPDRRRWGPHDDVKFRRFSRMLAQIWKGSHFSAELQPRLIAPPYVPGSTADDAQLQPRHPLQRLLLDCPEGPSFAQRSPPDHTSQAGSDRTLTTVESALASYVNRRKARVKWVQHQSMAVGEILTVPSTVRNAALRERGNESHEVPLRPSRAGPLAFRKQGERVKNLGAAGRTERRHPGGYSRSPISAPRALR
jgi:hypothetical protein